LKKIILVRHAKSSWDSGVSSDIDRPLNRRGKRDAPFMAEKLKEIVSEIDGSVKSPSQRTTDTSKLFLKVFEIDPSCDLTEQNLYHGSMYDILDAIHSLPKEWECSILFGHNPGMTYIVDYFGGSEIYNMPTCGIVIVESTAEDWAYINSDNSKINSFENPKKYFT
jgi:phosphohistidine phosphatase